MILREQSQKIDNYELKLKQNMRLSYSSNQQRLSLAISRFREKSHLTLLQEYYSKIDNIKKSLIRSVKLSLSKKGTKLKELDKNLYILNPLSILERGYSIIQNKSGISIKSSSEVEIGEVIEARLNEGFIDIEVKNIKNV
jgi:exodeoxyribonuclease VII large subunit